MIYSCWSERLQLVQFFKDQLEKSVMEEIFPGVWKEKYILTKNLTPGKRVYGEDLVKKGKIEYRSWDPNRSKPAAGIKKGLKTFPLKSGDIVLYLGAASGTTVSHFSDIVLDGVIYAVEISERSIRDLNSVAEARNNIVPILGNARIPDQYSWIEPVDIVFQDVATDDQSEILIRNCQKFLKKNGFAIISIKSRSIDVVKEPDQVYREELEKLKKYFEIVEKKKLDPYEKDHMLAVLKWK